MNVSISAHCEPGTSRLKRALEAGCRAVVDAQQPSGGWTAFGDIGPVSTAQAIVALGYIGRLDPEEARAGTSWLRARQLSDGSFLAYPSAPHGDRDATAGALAAFELVGGRENLAAARRARGYIEAEGGLDRLPARLEYGEVGALFLTLAGVIGKKQLPRVPVLLLTIPAVERLVLKRCHAGIVMSAYTLSLVASRGATPAWLRRQEARSACNLFDSFQNANGSWNSMTTQTALALVTLHAAGVAADDPRMARGVAWLKDQSVRGPEGLCFPAYRLPVWSTVFALRALMGSGLTEVGYATARGTAWLLEQQCRGEQAAQNNRNRGAPRRYGWAFDPGNDRMPDSDDTAAVLKVLAQARKNAAIEATGVTAGELERAIAGGRAWLLGMQSRDGGWASYTSGTLSKPRGPILTEPARVPLRRPVAALGMVLRPPLMFGDPATEDVTGRALEGLGALGDTSAALHVRRAVEFLKARQCRDGAFWSRWLVNYLAGTSFVLMGLSAVGAARGEWVARAVRWLVSRQNSDGSWGEGPESYRDPGLAGRGPGMAPLTGLVTSALVELGEAGSPSVARAIGYLLDRQESSGLWSNDGYLAPLILPTSFYAHGEAARYYPLEALGRYARAVSR